MPKQNDNKILSDYNLETIIQEKDLPRREVEFSGMIKSSELGFYEGERCHRRQCHH